MAYYEIFYLTSGGLTAQPHAYARFTGEGKGGLDRCDMIVQDLMATKNTAIVGILVYIDPEGHLYPALPRAADYPIRAYFRMFNPERHEAFVALRDFLTGVEPISYWEATYGNQLRPRENEPATATYKRLEEKLRALEETVNAVREAQMGQIPIGVPSVTCKNVGAHS